MRHQQPPHMDTSQGGGSTASGSQFNSCKGLDGLKLREAHSVSMDLGAADGLALGDEATERADAAKGVEDLNPTPFTPFHRDFTWPMFATMWTSVLLTPSSISVGAALLALGLNWWEATVAHFLGSVFTLVGLMLMAWPGVKYGIPFPVLARSSFGVHGAHFCTLTRGAVAVMWLSWNMWQGALGLYTGIGRAAGAQFLGWAPITGQNHLTVGQLLILIAFAGCHCLLIFLGVRKALRRLVRVAVVVQFGFLLGVLIWAWRLAPISDSLPSHKASGSAIAWLEAINSTTCVLSTLILNIADFSRFSPSQKDQMVGQSAGFPLQFTFVGWIGIVAAGASSLTLGQQMWLIPEYFAVWSAPLAILGCVALALSILVCNTFSNLISPMNDLLNLAPQKFNFRVCGYICVATAVGMCPWITFSSQNSFVQTFLSGYGMLTGSLAGICIIDFHVLRQGVLYMANLYPAGPVKACDGTVCNPEGRPATYRHGVNWRACVAVLAGCGPCLPGFVATLMHSHNLPQPLLNLYSVSFYFAFGASGLTIWVLTYVCPPVGFSRQGYAVTYSFDDGAMLPEPATDSLFARLVAKFAPRPLATPLIGH
eukprot:CAMPEP_0119106500 /NCGR_PEP_ID=MMETSP1180-20130426/4494_1 /TAXON_ID=3052 ORGANISM="Chlamydomonas cf sp, Strain CCMP681" /NCGR_SAMPLE_ID=MMETSP1180 /ASSEMBLY_ACC=CAM_ASM_000741 /LENGTH=595 /DNA_ID=CAMNT_0007091855 /DNA_START=112 /DNA_END=1899 /DNA_ORIENTATION=-